MHAHSQCVQRTAGSGAQVFDDTRVDRRRFHILMPEQLLYLPDIHSAQQQMRGERWTPNLPPRAKL